MDRSSQALAGALPAPQATPSEEAARREQAVRLADALGRLPEPYREVIVLRHLEGLSLAEAARRMGRTEDSVQKLWARSLLKLRESLGGTP
jgi:RNA polymerase sigma-70 factor, ECF subfamily